MLKRFLHVLLAMTLLMLTGCGGDPSGSDTPSQPVTEAPTEAPTETPTEEPQAPTLPQSCGAQFDFVADGIYNYCPSIMQVDENTAYIYYCTNRSYYDIVDYVGSRKGTRQEDGTWKWDRKEQIVLSPQKGAWDAHHTCDPSVIKGKFLYQGEEYSYLMAYLGCTSYDNQDNKIGLAVAKNPQDTFVRIGEVPFVDFEFDGSEDIWEWGVGQPSLVNMDKEGRVMMFYTRGDRNGTRTLYAEWDLSDLSAPVQLSGGTLSAAGLVNLNGGADIMNNADFLYDPATNRFYAVSDCHPNPSDEPNFISSHFRVTYFDASADFETVVWESLAQIGPEETGAPRNHDNGILRDAYGHLPDGYLTVFYTVASTGTNSLWTYRIHSYYLALP